MIKIKENPPEPLKKILMSEMQPLQIARIASIENRHHGEIVMRTASSEEFEVMSLSAPGVDRCWQGDAPGLIEVALISGSILLELFND